MTNKEIRNDIERKIVLLGGVKNAFKDCIIANAKCIMPQFSKAEKNDETLFYLSNMAISFSINGFKRAGVIKKLNNCVLYDGYENVVNDDIMEFAIEEIRKILLV